MSEKQESSGGDGCLSFIVLCFVFWATRYGVTCDDKHYDTSCTQERGVEVIVTPTERGLR